MGNSTAGEMNELVSLAAEINKEHNLAEQMAKTAIEHALKAGELLLEAKSQCSHGEWLPWLDGSLDIGARQAQKYMRLVNHRDMLANANPNAYLSIDDALAAIAAPKERETEQPDKQPHEMVLDAVRVIGELESLSKINLIETAADHWSLSYEQRLKIIGRFVKNGSGPLGDYFTRYHSLHQQASEFGDYYIGRSIADDMGRLDKTADEIIDLYVGQAELDSEWLKFRYQLSLTLAQPPELPNPSDLSDYLDSRLLAYGGT